MGDLEDVARGVGSGDIPVLVRFKAAADVAKGIIAVTALAGGLFGLAYTAWIAPGVEAEIEEAVEKRHLATQDDIAEKMMATAKILERIQGRLDRVDERSRENELLNRVQDERIEALRDRTRR